MTRRRTSTAPPPTPPLPLDPIALGFWDRHAGRLRAVGLLTAADVDSFAVLCVTWSKLSTVAAAEPTAANYREVIQFVNLLKQYQSLAKQFGLLPRDRRAAKLESDPPAPRDEFGL